MRSATLAWQEVLCSSRTTWLGTDLEEDKEYGIVSTSDNLG